MEESNIEEKIIIFLWIVIGLISGFAVFASYFKKTNAMTSKILKVVVYFWFCVTSFILAIVFLN